MDYGIVFLLPASQDIRVAHEWYEEQKTDLGKEFLQAVLEQVEELKDDFISHRFFIHPVRYIKMKRFPYSIFYIKDEQRKKITITAVLGNKQDMLSIIRKRL